MHHRPILGSYRCQRDATALPPSQGAQSMAMHYFHMVDGQTTFDSVGTDLPDLQSVRKEALRAGREMLNLGGGEGNSFGLGNRGGYGSRTSPMVPETRSLPSN